MSQMRSLTVLSLVSTSALFLSSNDLVLRVDLHGLLRHHVAGHGVVTKGLGLHDTLHIGGPSVLRGDENTWRLVDTVGDDDLLDLVSEDVLHQLAEWLEAGLLLFLSLLLLLGVVEVEAFLGA